MAKDSKDTAPSAAKSEFMRYPDNHLGEPKLEFAKTTDLRAVVKKHFGVE